MTYDIKIRTWLLIILAVVVVLGGGYTYWNLKGNKQTSTAITSPTPTISSAISPSVGTTASPTGNQTATPAPTATPTTTTTATPITPAGWKYDTQTLRAHGSFFTGQYTVLIKNDWTFTQLTSSAVPEAGEYLLGNPTNCNISDWPWSSCTLVGITFYQGSTTDRSNVYWTTDHKGYFTLIFPNNSLSESDKKIVTDSFSAGGTSQQ